MDYLEFDNTHIFKEQKATFQLLFETLNLDKVYFVGGVADYLNLRDHFEMPVHDVDIVYQDERDLAPLWDRITLRRHVCKFYEFDEMEVLVGDYFIYGKRVHIDCFKRNLMYGGVSKSQLLGETVRHSSFETMRKFHNDHVGKLTSRVMGVNYEWKRLYKHSKKASLYNLVRYKEQKEQNVLAYEN